MRPYWLVIGVLAVWRVTHLFSSEGGPWSILERMRNRLANTLAGELVSCFYCLSLWVAVPFALTLGDGWEERLLLWPALSAGAILINRFMDREPPAPAAFFQEDEEEISNVLRQE